MDTRLFREAMSRWASGVSIVACRHEGSVIATTVSAFLSLSLEPPRILVALGPNATVLPFLDTGVSFGVSVLGAADSRIASVFADAYPVTHDPFPAAGAPVLADAIVRLHCQVEEVRGAGHQSLIIAGVDELHFNDGAPLIRFRRRYHALADS